MIGQKIYLTESADAGCSPSPRRLVCLWTSQQQQHSVPTLLDASGIWLSVTLAPYREITAMQTHLISGLPLFIAKSHPVNWFSLFTSKCVNGFDRKACVDLLVIRSLSLQHSLGANWINAGPREENIQKYKNWNNKSNKKKSHQRWFQTIVCETGDFSGLQACGLFGWWKLVLRGRNRRNNNNREENGWLEQESEQVDHTPLWNLCTLLSAFLALKNGCK